MSGQLGLFGNLPAPRRTFPAAAEEAAVLARRLPQHVRFGTSSWTFPGWKGIVYEGDTSPDALACEGLRAYSEHPLFGAVGIDRSYYGPLTPADLDRYAAVLPAGFPALSKVWEEVTAFGFPDHPRYGARRGAKNPRFLDPVVFKDEVLAPYREHFQGHTGPFIFESPVVPGVSAAEHAEILARLERLLRDLPDGFAYAFELRTSALLTARTLDLLRDHGAGYVLLHWTGVPELARQLALPGVLTSKHVVARVLLPPGHRYEDARPAYEPFNRIVRPDAELRRAIAELAERCLAEGRDLTVIVGNKAEGSAPLTVRALAQAVVRAREEVKSR